MQSVALLSGLIGALISAGLSFWIRDTLDRRRIKEAERRVAYVHFVRISALVAMEIVCKSFIEVFVNDKVKDALKSKNNSYEPSHKVSVLIAAELKKLTPEKLGQTPGLSFVVAYLKSLLETLNESKLSAKQLSELPKESVLIYTQYLTSLSHLRDALFMWITLFEEKDSSWVSPDSIHAQWTSISRFFEYAKQLRAALIRAGAATASEASVLIKQQVEMYNENLATGIRNKQKLQAALAESEKTSV